MRETHALRETPSTLGVFVRRHGETLAALGSVASIAAQQVLLRAMADTARALFPLTLPSGGALALRLRDAELDVVIVRPADTSSTLMDFVASVPFAFELLEQILDDPYRALTVADHTGTMLYISPIHERFLGLPHGGAIGMPAEQAIPNSRLRAVVESGKAEVGRTQTFANGVTRVVSRRPVWKDGKVIGAVGNVMFRDAQAASRMADQIHQLRSQLALYQRELKDLRDTRESMADLVGDSQAMQRLRDHIARVAQLDVPVLIVGESGTGKELVARAIHRLGRPDQSLVSLNLAALPASLVESELFGHVPGAFTGSARHGRPGKLEMAHGGTLFLDEIGDVPPDIQIKLLRVLEDHVVERLGSHTSQQAAFRLVTATHRDMAERIRVGAFRHDLFYRISGVTLHLPPLRQRLEDIPALVERFVEDFCRRNGWPGLDIDPAVSPYLAAQDWPGNLRQLRHRVEEALVFTGSGVLTLDAFTRNDALRLDVQSDVLPCASPDARAPIAATDLLAIERAAARQTLEACGGNKLQAARQLGISRSYLYKLLAGSPGTR